MSVESSLQQLSVGMLLWEPRDRKHGFAGHVWCVSAVRKASATLIMAERASQVKATIKTATVPKGWHEVGNAGVWKYLDGVINPVLESTTDGRDHD